MASYSNAGEVLFACLAVYNLRGLERIFGSRKYAVRSHNKRSNSDVVIPHILIRHEFDSNALDISVISSSSILKSP